MTFGIRAMRLSFNLFNSAPPMDTCFIVFTNEFPTMFQSLWKKIGCRPSGLDAFLGLKSYSAALTSFSIGTFSSPLLPSSGILFLRCPSGYPLLILLSFLWSKAYGNTQTPFLLCLSMVEAWKKFVFLPPSNSQLT